MKEKLLFGITESGIMHTDEDPNISLENKFQMVKSSGVYDYLDKTPLKEDTDIYSISINYRTILDKRLDWLW